MFTIGGMSVFLLTLWASPPEILWQWASCWLRRNTSGVLKRDTSPPMFPAWQAKQSKLFE
jgi:hypothetical protein